MQYILRDCASLMEGLMPTFIVSMSWTDKGLDAIKDASKGTGAMQGVLNLTSRLGISIKEIYLTTGDTDLLAIFESPSDDNIARLVLKLGSYGLRTRTARAWPRSEFQKLMSGVPEQKPMSELPEQELISELSEQH
jgi:uncharacterized protein with GYD domain